MSSLSSGADLVPQFLLERKMEKTKPKVKLTGTDGNVFALAGKVSQALRRSGLNDEAAKFLDRTKGLWKL